MAGVDPPGPLVRWVRDHRAGCDRCREQSVNLGSGADELPDAGLAGLRRPDGDRCVLGEFGAGVEGERQAAFQVEHHDGAGRGLGIAFVLGAVAPEVSRPKPSR